MITFDDLNSSEQAAIDHVASMSREGIVRLMNNFDIGREHLMHLLLALHEFENPEKFRGQMKEAERDRDTYSAALECARNLPPSAEFRFDASGWLYLDCVDGGPHQMPVATTVRMFIAMLEAAHANSVLIVEAVRLALAKRAALPSATKKDRYKYWMALLSFWSRVLGRGVLANASL